MQDGLDLTVDQGLTECGYGDWTGKSLRELANDDLWKSVQTQPSAVRFPGGESMTEMSARAIAAGAPLGRADQPPSTGPTRCGRRCRTATRSRRSWPTRWGMHLDSFQRILVDPASHLDHSLYLSSPLPDHGQLDDRRSRQPSCRRRARSRVAAGGGPRTTQSWEADPAPQRWPTERPGPTRRFFGGCSRVAMPQLCVRSALRD